MVKEFMRFNKELLIVTILAVFAVRWLFLPGFLPTHDGEYHIIRFHEFETMIKSGYFFPRWAPGLNSSYGVPLFNFFYPFPNYVGVLFHALGLSLTDSFKLSLAIGYFTAVVFCYFWLSKVFARLPAVIGTIIFAYIPYWFVDIFVRGSVGEILAISAVMASFYSIESGKNKLLAISLAITILSHNILAMIFLPLLLGYGYLRKKRIILWSLLGILLASYFWIPALLERKYVVGLNTTNYLEHFPLLAQLLIPSWGTGFSVVGLGPNEMSFQIGITAFLVMLGATSYLLKEKNSNTRIAVLFFLLTALVVTTLMLPISIPIWEIARPLQLIQYPWRLLSILLPVNAVLGAYLVSKVKNKYLSWVIAILAIVFSLGYTKPVLYAPRSDEYYLTRANFTDGTSSLGNSFSTIWTPWKQSPPQKRLDILSGSAQVKAIEEKPLSFTYQVVTQSPGSIRLNVLYYPGWTALIDSKAQSIQYEDGTMTLNVPPGDHTVRFILRETPLRKLANSLSLTSFFWLTGSGILRLLYAHRYRYKSNYKRS